MRGAKVHTLGDLLGKYARLEAPQGRVIEVVIEVVGLVAGVVVTKEQVSYRKPARLVHIALSGPRKQEILLRKKEILNRISAVLGEKSAPHTIT